MQQNKLASLLFAFILIGALLPISTFAQVTSSPGAQPQFQSSSEPQKLSSGHLNRGFPPLPAPAQDRQIGKQPSSVEPASYSAPAPHQSSVQFSPAANTSAFGTSTDAPHASPVGATPQIASGKPVIAIPPKGTNSSKPPPSPASSVRALVSVATSLAIVLILFFGVVTLYKKSQPSGSVARLPSEVIQVLGRTTAGPRQSLVVLKFGSKLVLVSQQPGQTETISEITDPDEVERLTKICGTRDALPSQSNFANVFRQVASMGRKDI